MAEADLEPGAILVGAYTDPTPLFITIEGKPGYTNTRILVGELECSSRCGKHDRRLAS